MAKATKHFHDRMAIIFDLDKTLIPDSYDLLVQSMGHEPERFRAERVAPLLRDGWDASLARLHCVIQASRARDQRPVTREHLRELGRTLKPYPGVTDMFDRVRGFAREVAPRTQVEFYLLTCGYIEIPRAMSFAAQFTDIWGSQFHYDEQGEVLFPRSVITFPEKVRYVLQLAKGLGIAGPDSPAEVYRDIPEEQWHMPLDQIVYVGDGGSDMPVFSLLNDSGGLTIGVYRAESPVEWSGHAEMRADRRVENLARADYGEDSELMRSLELAVGSIGKLIELRRLGQDE